ncbi:N-acetylmuramidase family protein [Mesorhizobium sp. CAU 1741]|uniref:N-acetylmuramidase family protein n=1 Tax=Mesorhizobium sp. CAU 1741 TaxID=3140366 RepID=UPI00325A655F
MDFVGKALPLNDGDVRIIAGYLGCEIAVLRAVLQIEAAGKGFDTKRRPKMLFEPHIFYRELGPGSNRTRAVKEGLAYAKWKAGAYPSDSYPRLIKAMAIQRDAALRSASWNLGQVMGFNHEAAGFRDVVSFVEAMKHSEGAGLYAMARFIVSNGLQRHLRDKNWAGFAKGYNGSGYAKHGYHTKLANAYAKRPAAEKIIPPPSTAAELDALIGKAAPPAPAKPVPAPSHAPTPKPAPAPVQAPWWERLLTFIMKLIKRG